jgi:DNA-binding winged helix-turn-helix (wHTH) protein
MAAVPQPFRLGEWHAEPALNRLWRSDDDGVHLEPRVMAVLVYLAERGGDVVGKEELLREVWAGAFVEDVAVARSISALRHALGDDAASPRFIETIPKRGYRLIAPVELTALRRLAGSPAREAASGLDVDGLIDGAISRSGDSLRLTILLIERNGSE